MVSAVTDEIYALDRNPHYMDLPAGGDSVLLYVNPRWCGRMVYTIYKLLPVGEVLRAAWYVGRSDSLMRLAIPSAPDFSPTQESALLTLYLTDRQLALMKASWKHVWFSVEIEADSLAVDSAKRRQALRDSL
ncbi:MAG TPA: hypothetical protein VNX15_09670 [Gemmatimonadales bacterium]|nr:hypothetical protein [Gemmatimonadales bacterium]